VNPAASKEALKQAQQAAITSVRRIHRRVSPQRGMPAVPKPDEEVSDVVVFGPEPEKKK
jgi:hypothetical protein